MKSNKIYISQIHGISDIIKINKGQKLLLIIPNTITLFITSKTIYNILQDFLLYRLRKQKYLK